MKSSENLTKFIYTFLQKINLIKYIISKQIIIIYDKFSMYGILIITVGKIVAVNVNKKDALLI